MNYNQLKTKRGKNMKKQISHFKKLSVSDWLLTLIVIFAISDLLLILIGIIVSK